MLKTYVSMVQAFVETRYRPISILPCARSSILFIAFAHTSSSQLVRSSLWFERTMVQYAINPNVRADNSTRSQSVSSSHHAYGTLEIFNSSYSLSRTIDQILSVINNPALLLSRVLASHPGSSSIPTIACPGKAIACPGAGGVDTYHHSRQVLVGLRYCDAYQLRLCVRSVVVKTLSCNCSTES